jgi:hypothetical protein
LYTSAQRKWIENDMKEWSKRGYADFISELIESASKHSLLSKVFSTYDYNDRTSDIPLLCLSIMQHYGAVAPLMDWTYNLNVALFFATESVIAGNGDSGDSIDEFFSVYVINKGIPAVSERMVNVRTLEDRSWSSLFKTDDKPPKTVYYISDFEDTANNAMHPDKVVLSKERPLTSVFNQNIIPQEGLFLLNPYERYAFDDILLKALNRDYKDENPYNIPFACFNIKKDIADYVKRKIKQNSNIDYGFIYPDLKRDVPDILNNTLNLLVKN